MPTTLDDVLLDPHYSADASGGPEFATAIVRSGQGGAIGHRNANREDYVSRYEIEYPALTDARRRALRDFTVLREGMARGFRFLAPDAQRLEEEPVGFRVGGTTDLAALTATDGETSEFFIIKNYRDAANSYTRWLVCPSPLDDFTVKIVSAVNPDSVHAEKTFHAGYLYNPNPVLPFSKTLDFGGSIGRVAVFYRSGRLIFETPPAEGLLILITCRYHLPVAFTSDWLRFRIDEAAVSQLMVEIEEILPVELGLSPEIPIPGDITAPIVSISAPEGSAHSGEIDITGTVSGGAIDTRLYIDGELYGAAIAGASPVWTLDTLEFENGIIEIRAEARDDAGNIGISNTLMLQIYNGPPDTTPPEIEITFPAPDAVLIGNVTVTVNATDDNGIARVEFYRNSFYLGQSTSHPFSYEWNTTLSPDGEFALSAIAFDLAGNPSEPSIVPVEIDNLPPPDTTPPTVSITSPAENEEVAGTVEVTVTAADNVAVARVEFYLNGDFLGSETVAPFTFEWDTTEHEDGEYALSAIAFDAAENDSAPSIIPVSIHNNDDEAPSVPEDFAVSGAPGTSSIPYSWTASTDNVGVTGYRIEYATDAGFTENVGLKTFGNVTSGTVTELTEGVEWWAHIQARDAAGNWSAFSAPVSATTAAGGGDGVLTVNGEAWELLGEDLTLEI